MKWGKAWPRSCYYWRSSVRSFWSGFVIALVLKESCYWNKLWSFSEIFWWDLSFSNAARSACEWECFIPTFQSSWGYSLLGSIISSSYFLETVSPLRSILLMKTAVKSMMLNAELAAFYYCSDKLDMVLVAWARFLVLYSDYEDCLGLSFFDISSNKTCWSFVRSDHYLPTACLIWWVVRFGYRCFKTDRNS